MTRTEDASLRERAAELDLTSNLHVVRLDTPEDPKHLVKG